MAIYENPKLCVALLRQNAYLSNVNSVFVSGVSLDFAAEPCKTQLFLWTELNERVGGGLPVGRQARPDCHRFQLYRITVLRHFHDARHFYPFFL